MASSPVSNKSVRPTLGRDRYFCIVALHIKTFIRIVLIGLVDYNLLLEVPSRCRCSSRNFLHNQRLLIEEMTVSSFCTERTYHPTIIVEIQTILQNQMVACFKADLFAMYIFNLQRLDALVVGIQVI